uniref:Uncharacterized protein n=1 Tax=viral metagenome TaxID=1070528 RepID=A0A6H1ZF65_9ZZZZ
MEEITGENETVIVEETPTEPDALQKKVDELTATNKDLLDKVDKATESMKGHQRLAEERKLKLQKAEISQSKIDTLEKQMKVLIRMNADLVDRGDDEIETPKRRRSEEYLRELKTEVEKPMSQDPPEVQKALQLAEESGLDFDGSPELAHAYRLFAQGKYGEGLIATQVAVGDRTKTVEQKEESKEKVYTEEEEEEIARRVWERKGGNKTSMSKATGGSMTREQAFAKAAAGELSFDEQRKLGLI